MGTWPELLDAAALASQRVPFWLLVTGHSLWATAYLRDFTKNWLVSYWVTFFAAFGGGFLSALLLQNPGVAAISIFSKNEIGVCYTLTWWAFRYFPAGLAAWLYDALPPVRSAAKAMKSTLRATTVVNRVNAAVKLYPGVVAAPLILGTLGGVGGTLLLQAYSHCAGYKQGPNELSHPGLSMYSALVGAVLQYTLVHLLGLLSSQQGLGLVISLYVAHGLAQDLMGQPLDYTAPLAAVFHKIACIPKPDSPTPKQTAGKAGKAPRVQATQTKLDAPASNGSKPPVLVNGSVQQAADSDASSKRTTRRRPLAQSRN